MGRQGTASRIDVRAPFRDRIEKRGVILGVVFEVGVLNQNHFAPGLADAAAERSAFALILIL